MYLVWTLVKEILGTGTFLPSTAALRTIPDGVISASVKIQRHERVKKNAVYHENTHTTSEFSG